MIWQFVIKQIIEKLALAGLIYSVPATMRNVEKRADIYSQQGYQGPASEALAWSDKFPEIAGNLITPGSGSHAATKMMFKTLVKVQQQQNFKDTNIQQKIKDFLKKIMNSLTPPAGAAEITNPMTGRVEKIPTNWQNYLNQNKDFTRLQPSKISDEINQPIVQGVSGAVADASVSAMNIIRPQLVNINSS